MSAGFPLAILALPMALILPGASAQTVPAVCPGFQAVASADGAYGSTATPDLVVSEADAGMPAAQATLNSYGDSEAYAGFPYPGDTVFSGLAEGSISSSDYPLAAIAKYPSHPSSAVSRGPVDLQADAGAQSASATGTDDAGPTSPIGAATIEASAATGCSASGVVTSQASNRAEGMEFGSGLLRVGGVRTTATVTLGTDGLAKVTSHLDVGQITVAGENAELTEKGLVFGNSAMFPVPSNSASSVLAAAGITVNYLGAMDQSNSVVAPALQISVTQAIPDIGPATVTYTLGRAFASVTPAGSGGTSSPPPPLNIGGSTPPSNPTPPLTVSSSPASVPVGQSAQPPTSTAVSSSAPSGPSTPVPPSTKPATNDGPTQAILAAGDPAMRASLASIYPAIAVAAMMLFVGGLLLRKIGVKLGWI